MAVARGWLALAAGLLLGSAQADPPQAMAPVTPRRAAPDYVLMDLDGQPQRLAALRGRVVLINFWATWCPPCRRELPSMQRLWEALRHEDFVLHAVDVGEEEDAVLPFIVSTGVELQFPILLDRDNAVLKRWPVVAIPTTFVVDKQGRIAYRAVGGREWDDPRLTEQIRHLLRE